MTGCIDVDRLEDAGIGRAAAGVSPDGANVVLATPTDGGSTASAFSIDDRRPLWEAAVPGIDGMVTWVGDTVVLDRLTATDVFGSGTYIWGSSTEADRASITALDGATGEDAWTWPADLTGDASSEAGSTVPFVDGPDDLVVVSAIDVDGEDRDGRLVGLDATTGDEIWSVGFESTPDVGGFGGTVLALLGDVLTALDAATGEEIWSVPVTGGASGPRPDTSQLWGDDVIVATGDGITIADLATGELTEIPVQNAWSMRLSVTDTALAVIVDDGSATQLLVFARDT